MRKLSVVALAALLLLFVSCEGGGDSTTAPTATLTLQNNTTVYTITDFWCTLASNPSWGPDLLDGSIAPGESQSFTVPAGVVDSAAEESAGNYYWESYDNTVVSGGMYTWTLIDGDAVAY